MKFNNYYKSKILKYMIRSNSQKFESLRNSDDYQLRDKINEIKDSESEWQTRIEVPFKNDCRIM